MNPSRSMLIALLAVAFFALPAVAAKPVKPPQAPGAPTIVGASDNVVETLLDGSTGLALVQVGTARFFAEVYPLEGFPQDKIFK